MTVPSEPGAPLPAPTEAPPALRGLRSFGTTRQYVVLLGGAVLLGLGVAATITASLGVGSWQVFETGLMATTGASFGVVAVIESLVVLAIAWAWLDQRPGPATFFFALAVGPLVDLFLRLAPSPGDVLGQSLLLALGTACIGAGVGFYIGAGLGASAQDSLFVGLFTKFDIRPRDARVITDVSLVVAGWTLGGQIGLGTVLLTLGLPLVIEPAMRTGAVLAGLPAPQVTDAT